MKSKFFGLAAICILLFGVLIVSSTTASASTNVHGGSWAMVASMSGTPTYGGPNQNVTLEAGKTYQFNAWIRGAGTIALALQKGDWSSSVVYQQVSASADWQQFTATYTVPASGAGVYHAQIQDAYQGSIPATAYIDDVFFGEASGSNLLVNGDFELGSGNTAWSGVNPPFAIVNYPSYVHGGSWSMLASLSGNPTNGGPNQNVTLEAGKTYQYKAWIRGAGTIALALQKGDWSSSVVYQQVTASANWQQFTATYTVPAGGAGVYHAQIQDVYKSSSTATLYIDDVFFGEASGSNLLVNGDFELGSGNTAWSGVKTPFAIVNYAIVNYPSNVHAGTWSMLASLSGTPTYGGPYQNVTLEAGKTYQYKAWIRGAGAIALVLQKGDWSSSVVYQKFTASADWQQFTATYTVPAGGAGVYHAQIQDVYQGSSPATVIIDDVFFGEASGSNLLVNGDFELGSSNTAWSIKAPFAIVNYPINRSGMNWSSGVYKTGTLSDPTKINGFENWRGRPVDTVIDFPYRDSWPHLTNSVQVANWDGKPYQLVLAVPFFPEDGTSNFADCAANSYDSYWKTFGSNLVSHHEGNAIIRLGWEFNINPNHGVTTSNLNDGTWIGCFRKVVTSIRQTAPNVKIDWNVNRGDALLYAGKVDPANVYPDDPNDPGHSYVDYIGIDEYDMWQPALTQSAWDYYHWYGSYGIKRWIDFAASHGKQVSFPEWGLNHGDGSTNYGNDNPFYIGKMWSLFNSLNSTGQLAYEGYYDEGPGGTDGALDVPGLNPNSAPVYLSYW